MHMILVTGGLDVIGPHTSRRPPRRVARDSDFNGTARLQMCDRRNMDALWLC